MTSCILGHARGSFMRASQDMMKYISYRVLIYLLNAINPFEVIRPLSRPSQYRHMGTVAGLTRGLGGMSWLQQPWNVPFSVDTGTLPYSKLRDSLIALNLLRSMTLK
jgi:hypothetical protein